MPTLRSGVVMTARFPMMTSWCSRRPSFRGTSLGRRPRGKASGRKGKAKTAGLSFRSRACSFSGRFFAALGTRAPSRAACAQGGCTWREGQMPGGGLGSGVARSGRFIGGACPARARDRSSFAPESMEPAPPKRSRTRSHSSGGDVAALPRLGVEPGKHHVAEHDGVEVALAHGRCEVELAQEPGRLPWPCRRRPPGWRRGRSRRASPPRCSSPRARRRRAGKRLDRAAPRSPGAP